MENLGIRLNTPAVIGGGWAGLAAAITLAEAGQAVTLYESAPQLGGRARRVTLHERDLDNGQHILIGAYHATLRLLATVGVNADQAFQPGELDLRVLPHFHLRAAALPAPLHLAAGFLTARGITLRDKLAALRFLMRLQRDDFHVGTDRPLADYLSQHRQTEALCRYLWRPLCLAALNTPPAIASAQVFINVLRDAFFRGSADSRLLLPRVDLGRLLPEPAMRFIRAHGGTVHLGHRVHSITHDGAGFTLAHEQGAVRHSHVVCAVSPARAADLTAALHIDLPHFDYQPIYTIYLQYAADTRLPAPMLGLSSGLAQWVFDRGRLDGHAGLLAVVISGEGAHQVLTHEQLVACIVEELAAQCDLPGPIAWSQVIAEKRATFSCTPGLARPDCRTPLPRFYLAGDYTASDYPATLEAAVRSGVQCARLILESTP